MFTRFDKSRSTKNIYVLTDLDAKSRELDQGDDAIGVGVDVIEDAFQHLSAIAITHRHGHGWINGAVEKKDGKLSSSNCDGMNRIE